MISELRTNIERLAPNMPAQELEQTKLEMLSLLERLIPHRSDDASPGNGHGDGNGNGNGERLHTRLSRREREVMTMMLEGQRLKQIAEKLDISVKTVTTHRSRLMKKLRVEDNLGLYRYGIRNGLISA